MDLRQLEPNEIGSDGLPLFPITVDLFPNGKSWIAQYPNLPGYWGIGETAALAVDAMKELCTGGPIYQLKRVRFEKYEYQVNMLQYLREMGGVEAASEALKPNGAPLGFSQSDLFDLRNRLRDEELFFQETVELTDKEIHVRAAFAAGKASDPLIRALLKHVRARRLIMEHCADTRENRIFAQVLETASRYLMRGGLGL